jgi:NTE family protein
VLGVGGVLGEAWMSGFLAGASERTGIDFRRAEAFVGSSAGSIVAATLAAGVPPGRPGEPAGVAVEPSARASSVDVALERVTRVWLGAVGPVAGAALSVSAPGGALARAALLARLPRGSAPLDELRRRVAALRPSFDGRLRVTAVEMRTGRRVVFGAPGAPEADVGDAVAASCAVPGVFRPVRIGGRDYVDGGVWSPTNLDVAPVRPGLHVLCLVPTAALEGGSGRSVRALLRTWGLATALEAAALRRRGAEVAIVRPDAGSAAAMGGDLMDPRPRGRVAAAGFRQGLAAATAASAPASG